MVSAAMPVDAGLPFGTPSSVNLPEGAWDMAGLGASGSDHLRLRRGWQLKNAQVALLLAADRVAAKERSEADRRAAQRQRWQREAAERRARLEQAREGGQACAGHHLQHREFPWSKGGPAAFGWRRLYHALCGDVAAVPQVGVLCECVISQALMRMYTDHRVLGGVVLPGVSHVSLFAATGAKHLPGPMGTSDWHMSVKEVLFERPFLIYSGRELIEAEEAGKGDGQVGVPVTYCRASGISKEMGSIKPSVDFSSGAL
ncbi:unnamed protein product [Prorocentrum cordatum]|uniref:Polyketide synthase dehydratase domain-containing protein n=1 Tax=Prorocentrum cordatum TaxID=2364126 RepID=A0ABN9QGT8_9DINO|nr:unnamed protein product [Polarella glacialis]